MADDKQSRKDRRMNGRKPTKGPGFRDALEALVTPGKLINIVQIGANDGMINDPLHGFLRAHPSETQVILIEPQADLIPILTETYAFHPRKVIFEAAVGAAGRLTLYRVRKACWTDLVLDYGKRWPTYRAPTGVTSGDRDKVAAWVGNYYRGPLSVDEVIEEVSVEAVPTPVLIQRAGLFQSLDVLQVDVEGLDDHVIRLSDIPTWRPHLIHYENAHLGKAREAAIREELAGQGYQVERLGMNSLARRAD
ncbi:MAG: FkbM family methyltransferase [Rhodobacterales bacterium]|nr:FkbM family methyltransferase [Rhodobacterales bacterium]